MRISRPAAAREVGAAITLPTRIKCLMQGAKEVTKALMADVNPDAV
jgi:hypothetical protein